MKQLLTVCTTILSQLEDVVEQMEDADFVKPSVTLSHATVGQHLRHTMEFFVCLKAGFDKGTVNYDRREHNALMETDKVVALSTLKDLRQFISNNLQNRALTLELAYEREEANWMTLETHYWRELVYNIEHAIHHMALMKIGIREVAPYVRLSEDFGVAASTLRYKAAVVVGVR